MRIIPGVHGARAAGAARARKRLRSAVYGALVILTLCLATACGSTAGPVPPKPSIKDATNTPLPLWYPGVFLVAAMSNDDRGLGDAKAALDGLTNTINVIIGSSTNQVLVENRTNKTWRIEAFAGAADDPQASGGGTPDALLVFGKVAIASYRLVKNDGSTTDEETAHLLAAVDAINSAVEALPSFGANGGTVWLVGATPDLLAEGSSLNHVGGSPGSVPMKPRSSSHSWKGPIPNAPTGKDSTIYILDTLYGDASEPTCMPMPATPTVAAKTPTPTTATEAATCDPILTDVQQFAIPNKDTLRVEGYDYDYASGAATPDSFARHGLFIAAILHHLAPEAKLHLIQVLNASGAADVRSLIYGLHIVYGSDSTPGKTFVNMSLTLQPPTDCLVALWNSPATSAPSYAFTELDLGGDVTYYPHDSNSSSSAKCEPSTKSLVYGSPNVHSRLYVPLALVIQAMLDRGYTLVAAAGNESDGDGTRFSADMPAAFCGVHAVAAAQGVQPVDPTPSAAPSLAPYSNRPFIEGGCLWAPTSFSNGVPGVVGTPLAKTGTPRVAYATGTNVCSLYLGDQDSNNMGIWSGTSFAAPFVTAALAGGVGTSEQPC